MLLQIDLETRHHLTRKLVEILAVHTQILIGQVEAEVIEERSFQRGVSLPARIDERIADGASLRKLSICRMSGATLMKLGRAPETIHISIV